MQKTILFGMPSEFFLYPLIKENLVKNGFSIIDISFDFENFKYRSLGERANNFLRKLLFNDQSNKNKLRFNRHAPELLATLASMDQKADYAFLIHPDIYPISFLEKVKENTNVLIGYQWDGFNRFPQIRNVVHIFDRFFAFDAGDLDPQNRKLHFLTNFYFDLPRLLTVEKPNAHQLYFICVYIRERMPRIFNFLQKINSLNIPKKIIIYDPNGKHNDTQTPSDCDFYLTSMSYEKNLSFVQESSVLLDIGNSIHNGFSFRVFEALCYEKKLITNSREIRYFDFYNKNNIFIIGEDDEQDLEQFIFSPYVRIDDQIKYKYSFTNWLNYVLETPPFIPIDFPVI